MSMLQSTQEAAMEPRGTTDIIRETCENASFQRAQRNIVGTAIYQEVLPSLRHTELGV